MGICFGLSRAFDMLESLKGKNNAFIYGNIAHNKHIVEHFTSIGFKTIYSPLEAPDGSTVVIRAHGISDEERDALRERRVCIVDATCPLVLNNQSSMRESECDVILVGIKGHSETAAVEGVARRPYFLVENIADIDAVPNDRKYRLIIQTTFDSVRCRLIISELKKRGYEFDQANAICPSSERRREAIHALKGVVPFIYVVGDKGSANSRALVEEARSTGIDSLLIENESGIDLDFIKHFDAVGISAGSSTPDDVVEKVIRRLEEI